MKTATQLQARLESARALPELTNFIGGARSTPALERGSSVCDPNTGTPLQAQLSCSEAQVEEALASSAQAFERGQWEHTHPLERAEALEAIADKLDQPELQERMAFADAITTGAVIRVTRLMALLAGHVFRASASYLRENAAPRSLPGKQGDVEYFRSPWGPALFAHGLGRFCLAHAMSPNSCDEADYRVCGQSTPPS